MDKIKRFLNFLKKYLLKDTKYCLLYLYRLLIHEKKLNCQFYNLEEIKKEIKIGKSIIRIGDGEIGLLHYLPIHYQKWSTEIRNEFLKIIKEYKNDKNYILAIPIFVNYTNKELKNFKNTNNIPSNKIFVWMPLKITFEMLFNKKIKYIDSHIFYRDKESKILLDFIFSLNKIIILISDENSINDCKNSKIDNKINFYIKSPSINSFEERHQIKNEIEKILKNNKLKKEQVLILFKAGLAKTIIKDLSENNIQIIDIGRGAEYYINGKSLEYLI